MTRRKGRLSPESNAELETIDLTPDRTPRAERTAPDKPEPNLTPRMRQVLDAADRIVAAGGSPTAPDIATELGDGGNVGANRVRQVLDRLKMNGLWPHGDARAKPGRPQGRRPAGRTIRAADILSVEPVAKGADEIDILKRCVAAIESLEPAGRRRVWRYLADRFGEA